MGHFRRAGHFLFCLTATILNTAIVVSVLIAQHLLQVVSLKTAVAALERASHMKLAKQCQLLITYTVRQITTVVSFE